MNYAHIIRKIQIYETGLIKLYYFFGLRFLGLYRNHYELRRQKREITRFIFVKSK